MLWCGVVCCGIAVDKGQQLADFVFHVGAPFYCFQKKPVEIRRFDRPVQVLLIDSILLLLFALCNSWKNKAQDRQDHRGDHVQCKGEGILIIHAHHASDCGDGKAPAAEELGNGLIFDKTVFGRNGIVGVAQSDVSHKHPQVAHGHADRVQLDQLAQDSRSAGNEGLHQNEMEPDRTATILMPLLWTP